MKLSSDSFRNRAAMPTVHAAGGGNRHPQLRWRDVPAGTASFVVLCLAADRPDGDFCHWSVVDLPPTLSSLAAGALSGDEETMLDGVPLRQGLSDNGRPGYDGPGPLPDAARHYIFRIYALDVPRLELPPGFSCADVLSAIYGHIIDEAQLIGAYPNK
ncbi:YbhB/YbcL family Raf kinase inhibitor-like protein [Duganella sp. FT109W]|uniref:YbhB/YbcL family Raf kinase inhibitor-like protein n=1 Tax=Duganella margarita TaxID=2692170 RepID=A0ABW9WCH4_9BURK|nr:YbhB/YbcL family Raf kinase inhibitor-like protein [Duganella margarita]MYN38253.1 YbhB/YbcL family Raf kinase inhibitor-like protein [Duganella margarita]